MPNTNPELTAKQIKAGWEHTFSTNNPFCPCDLKSFTKAVNWAERALAATAPNAGAPLAASTVAAKWRRDGEPDPHAGHYDSERAALCMGNLTDDELANGAFMNYDVRPPLERIIDGSAHSPIAWMTAVKDRIRWLSRALEKSLAAAPAQQAGAPLTLTEEQREDVLDALRNTHGLAGDVEEMLDAVLEEVAAAGAPLPLAPSEAEELTAEQIDRLPLVVHLRERIRHWKIEHGRNYSLGFNEGVAHALSTPPQATLPASKADGKYDNVLRPFLALMERELHANSSKGDRPGWLTMTRDRALLEIYYHVSKLSVAMKNDDAPAIAEHSADVANMAMMALDVCGGIDTRAQPQADAAGDLNALAKAVEAMVGMLEDGEWAEHVSMIHKHPLASRLEDAITALHNELHEAEDDAPQADAAEPVAAVLAAISDYDAALKRREHGGVAMSKAFDAIRSAVEAQAPGARGEQA